MVMSTAASVPAIHDGGRRKALVTTRSKKIRIESGGVVPARSVRRSRRIDKSRTAAGADKRWASNGTNPMATTSDANSGKRIDIDTTRIIERICSLSKSTNWNGKNTTAVVRLAAVIARTVRRNPSRTASVISVPRSRRRWTASNTTTLLSITSPMAIARPINVMMLMDWPLRKRRARAARRLIGTAMPTTATARHCRRKRYSTTSAIKNPVPASFPRRSICSSICSAASKPITKSMPSGATSARTSPRRSLREAPRRTKLAPCS